MLLLFKWASRCWATIHDYITNWDINRGGMQKGSISFFYSLSLKSVLLSPIESKNLCSSLKIQECMENTSSQ